MRQHMDQNYNAACNKHALRDSIAKVKWIVEVQK